MEFFQKNKKIIARIVIILFIFCGGYSVVFNMTMGIFSQSSNSAIFYNSIDSLKNFKVEDYYKLYEKGKNYKIYIKRIFMDVFEDYCYLKKYEIYDSKGNIAYERERALINIRITKHDFDILEVEEIYDDSGIVDSLFYNVQTNEISTVWYDTVDAENGSFIVKTKGGPAAIIRYGNKLGIANLYDKDKYFKNIKLDEDLYIPRFKSLNYINENEVEIIYFDINNIKRRLSFPLINDEIGCNSFDSYEYKLKSNAITIDQNLYESCIENMTYDEICTLIGAKGEMMRYIEYGEIAVYGYKGESQEIFLTFYQNKLGEKKRYFNISE